MTSLAERHDALFLDLDGTVYRGGDPIEYAIDTLTAYKAAGGQCLYITNNASRPPHVVAEQLRSLGLDAGDDDVLTSAQAVLELAFQKYGHGARIFILGADSFKDLARQRGFEVVASADDSPVAVLHGHNPQTGWAQLSEAALAIRGGAEYFASNLDTTLPLERGLHVGNGSMVAAVTSATGVRPTSAGKPEPFMFELALHSGHVRAPLAVGDRLDTDIAGGLNAQLKVLMVLTGVDGHLSVINAPASQRATFIATDLRAINDAPETLDPRCDASHGGFHAEFDAENNILSMSGRVHASVSVDQRPMLALRAAASAVWAHSDEEHAVDKQCVQCENPDAQAAVEHWW